MGTLLIIFLFFGVFISIVHFLRTNWIKKKTPPSGHTVLYQEPQIYCIEHIVTPIDTPNYITYITCDGTSDTLSDIPGKMIICARSIESFSNVEILEVGTC